MIVTVFGGTEIDDELRSMAYEFGKRVALAGHVLKNGGNFGVMEESAKGCREAGGEVIGVCLRNQRLEDLNYCNSFLSKRVFFEDYNGRICELLKTDRIVILPGQVGTLEEFFVAWMSAVVGDLPPVYLVGEKNRKFFDFLMSEGFVKEDVHLPYVRVVDSIDEVDFL